jgi:hypothetical protein
MKKMRVTVLPSMNSNKYQQTMPASQGTCRKAQPS